MLKKKWYILRVSSGFENTVYNELKNNKNFDQIYSPVEIIKTISDKKQIVEKKNSIIKGYIWVKCEITDEILNIIKKTRYVVGFLGGGKNPSFTSDREMEIFKNKSQKEAAKIKNIFSIGDNIKVCQGSFKSFSGIIDSIDQENCKASIFLRILGKKTKVNISLSEIKKED